MRIALFQPDLPPNVGTLVRMGACLGLPVDIIRPCGFPLGREALRRSAMDYFEQAEIRIHDDWAAFQQDVPGRRVLLTTKASVPYTEAAYAPEDVLVMGQESVGAPDFVHDAAALRVRIPMRAGLRSLNVALAAAMVAGEALRQTGLYPQ
ncbi:tRNA (cytidine(34)-2'-O)-methyltransferase [Sphingosinicella microcystinivorans]|uniref:tRNA (cytidine(34)-2'-O)-methyltransferase n=1 Tax=Sphingosinicella microcystinivorans TaxID=335406 RepID=UPI0022F3DD63|nr:tRNA (cytidine(34)-2'-O)-methyltransferase [Sphingosinicella microcystinivorans]WBX86439.1 tRNA (cytidine(34)-2'-O)-methyltransferase [Sphingosinicella microcystinivorans]